jgi:hypothetical protein
MENTARSLNSFPPAGTLLAPIHSFADGAPLRICVCLRSEPDPRPDPFVLIRELPGSRVYLGAVCDEQARLQEWVEIWVQTLDLRDVVFSGSQERLANYAFDQRWRSEHRMYLANLPDTVIVTGMEQNNPRPLLIKRPASQANSPFAPVEPTSWRICKDDALLDSFGLAPYSTSPFRYLYDPDAAGPKIFIATAADAPANSHVQGLERLKELPQVIALFNPQAGLIRVTRFCPLGLDDYLQILEGRPWSGAGPEATRLFHQGVYAELQAWSASPKGMPFLLYGGRTSTDRLNEVLFLKLSALLAMFKEVRTYVQAHQLPLLNLAPASFSVQLPEVGDQFPALWPAKCLLVKPGQAHALQIKSTEQKYFLRLGRIEPSPFLPEGLGAHSFGIGSIRLRNVQSDTDGTVLEGTLVAEDYLGIDPQDLLWFKLPLAEQRLEFHAHVYASEAVGPKEARFRTVPARLPDPVVAALKRIAAFAKSPYEIWPLLSSPCDLHSLGILATRMLLANSQSNFPVIVDDVLGLARRVGKDPAKEDKLLPDLQALLDHDPKLFDLVSPHSLVEPDRPAAQAWSQIHKDLWLEAVAFLLRLFPGAGSHCYCQGFGDVSPLALEMIFDRPVQELETLVLRLRSVLVPSLAANEEIASLLLEQLEIA